MLVYLCLYETSTYVQPNIQSRSRAINEEFVFMDATLTCVVLYFVINYVTETCEYCFIQHADISPLLCCSGACPIVWLVRQFWIFKAKNVHSYQEIYYFESEKVAIDILLVVKGIGDTFKLFSTRVQRRLVFFLSIFVQEHAKVDYPRSWNWIPKESM